MTALDDRRDMRALVLKQAEILVGVAVDDQQVRISARHDLAELARTLHDLGVDDSRGVDYFVRLHRFGPDQELPALIVLKLTEQIAAEPDLHSRRDTKLERAQARFEHDLVFLQAVAGHSIAGLAPLHRNPRNH